MATGRAASTTAATDDAGVAGAVGAVLLLALMITVYAHVATVQVPQWGHEAEEAWDHASRDASLDTARFIANALGTDVTLSVGYPSGSNPRALDVPLLGRTEAARGTGVLTFDPSCTSFDASHKPSSGPRVQDLDDVAQGCLVYEAQTAYEEPFAYRLELGGVLRVQGDRAVVLRGPALALNATSDTEYRASLTLPTLTGAASAGGGSDGALDLTLTPKAAAIETASSLNAGRATWELTTRYPGAWEAWFERQFEEADWEENRHPPRGMSPRDYRVRCIPTTCEPGADGTGTVRIELFGPQNSGDDLRVALSYGLYAVKIE